MFAPRTKPLTVGEQPWNWSDDCYSKWQCTWWVYYRCLSVGFSPPCWYDGSGDNGFGSYTDAKEWKKHVRDPWVAMDIDYTPVAGDVVIYDGTYGHVQFMETDTMYSEYSSGNPDSFRNGKLADYSNKSILGYLHYPYNAVEPVERNTNVNQIQTTDISLRIRTKPSLSGEIVGYVQKGYYNVLDQKEADGYTWYKLAKDRWCANITTIYLPSDDEDIIKEIERYFDSMKQKIKLLSDENMEMKSDLKEIENISRRWTT